MKALHFPVEGQQEERAFAALKTSTKEEQK